MKRTPLTMLALVALTALCVPTASSAAAPSFSISGFQYSYTSGTDAGLAGYVSVPALAPTRAGTGPTSTTADGLGMLSNLDRVSHTFTECTSACDTANGNPGTSPLFDIRLTGGASAAFVADADLQAGTYTFMCRLHPYMRGEFTLV